MSVIKGSGWQLYKLLLAMWLLGPVVKAGGFFTLLLIMAGAAACTAFIVLWMPDEAAMRLEVA